MNHESYQVKDFNLSGMRGISEPTVEMHLNLYKGYVQNTNLLREQLSEMIDKKSASPAHPVYADLRRRLGFEYGGMFLHELYFQNLAPKGKGTPSGDFQTTVRESFGSYENWQNDFISVGKLRGVGWAILYQDPETGWLSNHWIVLHAQGVPTGLNPVLVMDMWEHAFLLDYRPGEKEKYIEAFFLNLDWSAVNRRLMHRPNGRLPSALLGRSDEPISH